MVNKRSFLRATDGTEEFAEISWTRRALEVAEGIRGTPGKTRERTFKSQAEVEAALHQEIQGFIDKGFAEYHGDDPLRIEPAEHVAKIVEQTHLKDCAVPVFSLGAGRDNGSRRGGLPWLAPGDAWPACTACLKPMRFILQVALREVIDIHGPLPHEGLLQIFVCDSECFYEEGWEPFSGKNLVRVLATAGGRLAEPPPQASDQADFLRPESRIEGWTRQPDAPGPDPLQALTEVDFDTAFEAWELLKEKGFADRYEKIGGWPSWIQDEEEITCDRCNRSPMVFAMQLGESIQDLDIIRSHSLYVMVCPKCGRLASTQQR